MANIFDNMKGFIFPNTVVNDGPLPPTSTTGLQQEFQTPDGLINETSALLSNVTAYAYGPNPSRPSTQTSYVNHPHRIQKIIPKIFIPAANAENGMPDIALEHALHDGDLAFTVRMPKEMIKGPSQYCQARNLPGRTLAQVINLATVNYLLWGLQIGRERGNARRNKWQDFFLQLTEGQLSHLSTLRTQKAVWMFLQTYIRPFGIMVGSDMQGGQHEGGQNRVATYPVDYVCTMLIDGKARKLNNHWRHVNIAAGDDVILVLKKTTQAERNIVHVLTSGSRAFREERTESSRDWWYLCPAVAKPESYESPFIHIGRSQGMYSAYNVGMGMGRSPWDARASILGQGIQVTFAPTFYTPITLERESGDAQRMLPVSAVGGALPQAMNGTQVVELGQTSDNASMEGGVANTSSDCNDTNKRRRKPRKEAMTGSILPRFAMNGTENGETGSNVTPIQSDADASGSAGV